jgi:hypothetical protein
MNTVINHLHDAINSQLLAVMLTAARMKEGTLAASGTATAPSSLPTATREKRPSTSERRMKCDCFPVTKASGLTATRTARARITARRASAGVLIRAF